MGFEQNKNAQLVLVTSPAILLGTFDTSANAAAAMKTNAIPGITAFSWDPQHEVNVRGSGQFGKNKPVGMTTIYKGIKGNMDAEGSDGNKFIQAALNRIAKASFVSGLDNKLFEFYGICNVTEDDGAALSAHFIGPCRVDSSPKNIGGDAKRYSFQGLWGIEFAGKKIKIDVTDGAGVPVTNCTLPTGDTAVAWKDEEGTDRYALLAMRFNTADSTVKILERAATAAAGYYSETSSAITLHTADQLATGDKLITVYVV